MSRSEKYFSDNLISKRYKVLVVGVKVPFTSGGQDVLVKTLVAELKVRGFDADLIELPFCPNSKEEVFASLEWWRAVELDQLSLNHVDCVICTKFPSYFVRHPRKSIWLVHQYREIYDLHCSRFSDFSDNPKDEALRELIVEADRCALLECGHRDIVNGNGVYKIFGGAISKNVSLRLERFCNIKSDVLYPPLPLGDRYYNNPESDRNFILSVGRICTIKRIDLLIKSLPKIDHSIQLKIVGCPDEHGVFEYLKNEIAKHHLSHRVEFLGKVPDEDLLKLYADCLAVYYAPFDEDYGYVTIEAMASAKPVVTCSDSGGTLEFVDHKVTGLICDPTPNSISEAFNLLVKDHSLANQLGTNGRQKMFDLNFLTATNHSLSKLSWDRIVSALVDPHLKLRPSASSSSYVQPEMTENIS